MTLDDFLATARDEHGDQPQQVADQLAANLHLVDSPAQVRGYARLVTHVYGEHLGHWARGEEVLHALGRQAGARDDSEITTGVATLRYAAGDESALQALPMPLRADVLAGAASMFAAREEWARGIAAYRQALALAAPGLPAGSPASRSMAIGGNNLAAALEGKAMLEPDEARGMVEAAQGGLTWWKQAGTWLEEERAEYQLARCQLKAGDTEAAIDSAARCIAVCERNGAPPFERFFGHAVLAIAQRAAGNAGAFHDQRRIALDEYAQVAPDEQQWCTRELGEVGGP